MREETDGLSLFNRVENDKAEICYICLGIANMRRLKRAGPRVREIVENILVLEI
jgi:hypothetical protein